MVKQHIAHNHRVFVDKQSQSIIWITYGFWGRLIASLTVISIVIFSVKWQTRHRIWHQEHRDVIQKIDKLFHCHEKGWFDPLEEIRIFPERWIDSVKKRSFFI